MKVKRLALFALITSCILIIAVLLSLKKNRVLSLVNDSVTKAEKDSSPPLVPPNDFSHPSPMNPAEQTSDDADCSSLQEQYQPVEKVKKNPQVSLRFSNLHKRVEGIVYRLRFFYKESNEGRDVPTYLLYKEDANEDDYIIEKSSYKKGPKYQSIERSEGDTLYKEEGLTHLLNPPKPEEIFLHFENDQLKNLQGLDPLAHSPHYIECSF